MTALTLLNFSEVYPDEESCVEALRRFREGHAFAAAVAAAPTCIGTSRTVVDMQPLQA